MTTRLQDNNKTTTNKTATTRQQQQDNEMKIIQKLQAWEAAHSYAMPKSIAYSCMSELKNSQLILS